MEQGCPWRDPSNVVLISRGCSWNCSRMRLSVTDCSSVTLRKLVSCILLHTSSTCCTYQLRRPSTNMNNTQRLERLFIHSNVRPTPHFSSTQSIMNAMRIAQCTAAVEPRLRTVGYLTSYGDQRPHTVLGRAKNSNRPYCWVASSCFCRHTLQAHTAHGVKCRLCSGKVCTAGTLKARDRQSNGNTASVPRWPVTALASTPPKMPGTHPLQYFGLGGRQWEYPHQYYYIWVVLAQWQHLMVSFCSSFCSKIQNLQQNRPKPHWGSSRERKF